MMVSTAPGKPWSDTKMIEASKEQPISNFQFPQIRVRTFKYATDLTAVIDLWANAGPGIHLRRSDEPEEIRKKLERDADLFVVAEIVDDGGTSRQVAQNNTIIGAVMGGFDGRRGMVYHLAVTEAYRKQGVAVRLMNELENRMRAKGCIRSYLLVTADNLEAIRFYEAQNWKRMELFTYGKDLD